MELIWELKWHLNNKPWDMKKHRVLWFCMIILNDKIYYKVIDSHLWAQNSKHMSFLDLKEEKPCIMIFSCINLLNKRTDKVYVLLIRGYNVIQFNSLTKRYPTHTHIVIYIWSMNKVLMNSRNSICIWRCTQK